MGRALVICLLLLALLQSAGAASNGIHLFEGSRTPYATEQFLFSTCYDKGELSVTASCSGGQPKVLESHPWNGCRLHILNLTTLPCEEFSIKAKDGATHYTERISKDHSFDFLEEILQAQDRDGGWLDELTTAQNIWILSRFNDTYSEEITKGVAWLKGRRGENEKCWGTHCPLRMNAEILLLLTEAGLDESSRIVRDGIVWLGDHQNIIEGSSWSASIQSDDDATCTFYNEGSGSSVDLDDDGKATVSFTATHGKNLTLNCSESHTLILFDHKQTDLFEDSASADENITFQIVEPCLSPTPWASCDDAATLYAAANDLYPTEGQKLAKEYLITELLPGGIAGEYLLTDDPVLHNALFVQHIEEREEVLNWLLYEQNNDGSWGAGSESHRIDETAKVLLSLESLKGKRQLQESIGDGKEWIAAHRPLTGWKEVLKDALTLFALADRLPPHVQATPSPIILNESMAMLTLEAPPLASLENLSLLLSPELQSHVRVSGTEALTLDQPTMLEVKKRGWIDGTFTGLLTLRSNRVNLTHIPIIVENHPWIEFSPPERVFIFGKKGNFSLPVEKSDSLFLCTLQGEELAAHLTPTSFGIQHATDIAFTLESKSAKQRQQRLSGNISCASESSLLVTPLSLAVEQFSTEPLRLEMSIVELEPVGEESIVVKNLLDIPINVQVMVESPDGILSVEETLLSLEAGERGKVHISSMLQVQEQNATEEELQLLAAQYEESLATYRNAIIFSVLGHEERLTVTLKERSILGMLVKIVGFLLLLGIVGYALYTLPQLMKKWKKAAPPAPKKEEGEKKVAQAPKKGKKRKSKHKGVLKVSVAMHRALGKEDAEIIAALQQQGFLEEDITAALAATKEKP